MQIKVKKLNDAAVLPKFSREGDAGADLVATSCDLRGDLAIYGLGIAVEIPQGYYMQIAPRSSILNYDLELVNSFGVIDSGYRGEIKLAFRRTAFFSFNAVESLYSVGERIGQAIIRKLEDVEYVEAEELSDTRRGEGGFGSTGK